MVHGGIIRILHLIPRKRLRNVSMNISSLTLIDLICVLNMKNRCGKDTVLVHSTSNVLSPQAAWSYGRKNKLTRIMRLQIKVMTKKKSRASIYKVFYLYIKLDGQIYHENLNMQYKEKDEGSEEYQRMMDEAEKIRLSRMNCISNDPDFIFKEKLSKIQPPAFLYMGKIHHKVGRGKSPDDLIRFVEENLYQKVLPFYDFIQFVKNIKEKIESNSSEEFDDLSTLLRILPPSHCYNELAPFISFSILHNKKIKILECIGYPCNEVVPQNEKIKCPSIKVQPYPGGNQIYISQRRGGSKTYLMKDSLLKCVKIGKSIDVLKRERTLEAQNPNISLFAVCENDVESELHQIYREHRVRGEWFNLNKKQIDKIIRDYNFSIIQS